MHDTLLVHEQRRSGCFYFLGPHRKWRLSRAQLDTGRRHFIHFIRILVPSPPLLFSPPGKMSAPVVLRSSGPALCPSFAEVCSFLERYGAALDLPEVTFPQMERYLRDTTAGERSPVLLLLPELGSVESCDTTNRRRPPPFL